MRQRQLLTGGAIGMAISAVGLLFNVTRFMQAYLATYLFLLALTLGSLALAMVHQLSGGAWGVMIRRVLGAAARTLPVVTLLFLPIAASLSRLYPWVTAHDDAVLVWKGPYLNVPFFLVRAGIYFAAWNTVSFFLNRWSLEQDATSDPRIAQRMQFLSAGGLVVYGLTITFASFDWIMSLEPHWSSTIFGILMMGGQALGAMAFAIVAADWLSRRPPMDAVITPAHFHDLGNLLLAFVMLWAYFAFSQYLIIWSGNLPEEIDWYLHRVSGGWQWIGLMLVSFHFAIPFMLLLSRAVKRRGETVAKVAAAILLMRYVDLLWLTAPAFRPGHLSIGPLEILLPLSLGAVWLGYFVYQLRGRALLPLHDPEFGEVVGELSRG
jgi:hypothetical protein